jgi:hypothetical protein
METLAEIYNNYDGNLSMNFEDLLKQLESSNNVPMELRDLVADYRNHQGKMNGKLALDEIESAVIEFLKKE